ncbi:DUF2784 domain-containing protein [Actinopolymorpha alba]|uniref:DUF2784 domain-containing protein n=1 Tax=Actinopolymorpha alba TaxID=533267 RepID=UPI000363585B|nr:DUF2784 domain-containing protein [Actinopolymorpha alba]
MGYRVLASTTAATHFLFLAYVIAGGFMAWRWPRMIIPHVVAVAWALVGVIIPLACPLTAIQNWLRHKGGEAVLHRGFIDHYVTGVLYPARYESAMRVLVACVVVVSWLGVYQRRRTRRMRMA